MAGESLDWPLSREEKKCRILRLYNSDVQAADQLLQSGEAALEALRDELDTIRRASFGVSSSLSDACCQEANCQLPAPMSPPSSCSKVLGEDAFSTPRKDELEADAKTEKLREAVQEAAAALQVLMGSSGKKPDGGSDDDVEALSMADSLAARQRARSEGSRASPKPSALRQPSRRRRWSRGGKGLRVSFADKPKDLDDCEDDYATPRNRTSLCEPEPGPEQEPVPRKRWALLGRPRTSANVQSPCPPKTAGSPIIAQSPELQVMSLESFLNEDVPSCPFDQH